jgi:hypothetical protein
MAKKIGIVVLLVLFLPVATAAATLGSTGDERHDFDWNFGTWKTHIKRLAHPLTGSNDWVAYEGVVTVRPAFGGSANVEEIEVDGPSHLELLDVRIYDPQSHQWIVNGSNSRTGTLEVPGFGSFANGRGVFYDQEAFEGRMILVRQTFFDITPVSYSFEQAFSDDGARTWEPNFVAHLDRTSSGSASEASTFVADTSHDFDFHYGTWETHIKYLRQSSSDTPTWGEQSGTVAVRKIWSGRAVMEEINVGGKDGFSGLTLFLYDPLTRRWNQTYADSNVGTLEPSMTGTFHNGRGELMSHGLYGGKMVLQRGVWSNITANAHDFEVDVSQNGGLTWKPVFVAALTRIGPGL